MLEVFYKKWNGVMCGIHWTLPKNKGKTAKVRRRNRLGSWDLEEIRGRGQANHGKPEKYWIFYAYKTRPLQITAKQIHHTMHKPLQFHFAWMLLSPASFPFDFHKKACWQEAGKL